MIKLQPVLGKIVAPPELSQSEIKLLSELESIIEYDIAPYALENDSIGRYPITSMQALRKSQIFKFALPSYLGGHEVSHSCSLEAQFRLAMADCSVAQLFKVHDELVREIFQYCSDGQKKRLSKQILNENAVLGLAVAEPGKTAVDPLKTVVVQQADGSYILDGFKIYTTAAAEADYIATWAFNAANASIDNPISGMQLFLIPANAPGVQINRDWSALGQRATDSGSIKFTQVQCPPHWLASEQGKAPLIHSSVRYQAGFCAVLVGIGFGAIRAALPYIQSHSRAWAPGSVDEAVNDPFIRRNLGKHIADLSSAYLAVQSCGRLLDAFERGEIDRAELALPISSAKVCANESALAACSAIHGLMGTGSVLGRHSFDYWWRNARTLSLHDPVEWKFHELGRHALTGWEPEPGVYQ